jgi:hypothetical protein
MMDLNYFKLEHFNLLEKGQLGLGLRHWLINFNSRNNLIESLLLRTVEVTKQITLTLLILF